MMKSIYIILSICYCFFCSAQEQNPDWINQMDIANYKVYKKTSKLDNIFLSKIETERNDIANSTGKFSFGCTGKGKHIRLNWMAVDKNNHQIISLSYGGKAYYTSYFLVDYDNESLNLRTMRVLSSNRELTLEQVVESINENNYEWK